MTPLPCSRVATSPPQPPPHEPLRERGDSTRSGMIIPDGTESSRPRLRPAPEPGNSTLTARARQNHPGGTQADPVQSSACPTTRQGLDDSTRTGMTIPDGAESSNPSSAQPLNLEMSTLTSWAHLNHPGETNTDRRPASARRTPTKRQSPDDSTRSRMQAARCYEV